MHDLSLTANMTDASDWVCHSSLQSDRCLQDFHRFPQVMAKVYGDTNQQCVAVIALMQGYIQLPKDSVRAYANSLKAIWSQAGWNLQKHEEVLYDIACAGLHNSLKNKVELMTHTCGTTDTLDEFFDNATSSEATHVRTNHPQQQQKQQQHESSRNSLRTRLPKAANEAPCHLSQR